MAEEKDKGTIFDEPKEDPKEVGVKDGFLPPEEHEESSEKFKEEMDSNERDEDVYTKEGREELLEDDEVSNVEQAWTEGAEGKGHKGVCAHCGKPLSQEEDEVIEREIDGELVWFCCEKCAKKGPKKE
jgi:hypothetical protein